MSIELNVESPIGTYDRNTFFLVTLPDGSHTFYPRSAKSSHGQTSPLSWWKKCGFFTEDRDIWAKSVMHPEHAQIMKRIGISPSDLFNTLLSPADVEDVMAWLNVYKIVFGRTSKSLREFKDFVHSVEECQGYRTKNYVTLGKYIAKVRSYRIDFNSYSFAAGNDEWLDAICKHLDHVKNNSYLAPLVKSLMQVGATTDAIDVLVCVNDSISSQRYAVHAMTALGAMFSSGEFTATVDAYATTRLLAEALYHAPQSAECIRDIFFSEGSDRQRLRDLVVVEGVSDALRLSAIFKEEVPTALVGGFL